jgi:hypothetical protein
MGNKAKEKEISRPSGIVESGRGVAAGVDISTWS